LIGVGKSAAKNLPGMLLKIVVVFFTLFFLFRDGPRIVRHTLALLPLTHEQAKKLLQGISDTIVASVYGSVAVGVAQGFLTGLAFWILGLPSPIVAAVLAAVASLIPVVGTGLVWVPGAVLLLLSGHGVKALILLVIGSAIIAQVDVVVRPYVVSESSKLNGLLIFFALLGGIEAFGIMGVIIGPVVISITIAVLHMLQEINNATGRGDEDRPLMAGE
jgi:predicted PurR-regulated permease PerM